MKTPREKAGELVMKMYHVLPAVRVSKSGKEQLENYQYNSAKESALTAVDAIQEAIDFDWMEVQNLDREHAYWNQVKQEIENL